MVPSVNGEEDLLVCLEALEAQRRDVRLEVLVADRCGDDLRATVTQRFPWARILPAAPGTTIPQLRAMAFAAASADAVAVIEDHVIVPPGWAAALLGAMRGGAAVVGGAVENAATDRVVDWAAFLCEYSHCLQPLPAGPSTWLTGNNVVYRKDLLERHRAVTESGQWENHLHDALRAEGVTLLCRPDITVGHRKHYTIRQYLSQRYLFARSYAGARAVGASLPRRLAYGVAALALPPLLGFRIVSRVVAKKRHRRELLRSIPLLAVFVTAWAAGEAVGYVTGAGDSLARVR
ncbi:MAG: glycosyltransferase [Gemmatimonadota bacterium]|nr:glycosyltransferase [Gemmatimonadota bacterium]